MIEYAAKPPTIPIPFHKLLKVVALVDGDESAGRARCSIGSRRRGSRSRSAIDYDRDVLEDAAVGAYIVAVDGDRLEPARKLGASGARRRLPHAAVGARGLAQDLPTCAGARQ